MDIENKEPIVGFRIGAYIEGKTCVAPVDNVTNIPQRMKDVVNVSFYRKNYFTLIIIVLFLIIYYLVFSKFGSII